MCLYRKRRSSKTADQYYKEMKVEPEPLPSLPTGGDSVERRQRSGLRGVRLQRKGQEPRTLLNIYGGQSD